MSMTSADVVAEFCLRLPRLRRLATQEGRVVDLDALVREAIKGEDVADRLVELSRQIGGPELRTRGAGPGDAIPFGDTGVQGGPFGPGRPVGARYVCPHGQCNRVERRTPGGALPECRLDSRPLVPRD